MTDERFTKFLEQAEERGCIELSALNEFSQSLELDEPEVEELYDEVETRGIELADDCGQETHGATYVNGDLIVATTDAQGQAQVQCFEHRIALPAFGQHLALHHLEQKMRAPARGVLLFHGGAIAGAHGAFLHPPALSDSHAPQRRLIETAVVLSEVKMRGRLDGTIVGAQPQILVDAVRIHHLPGIHLAVRIPQRLELAESSYQIFAIHLVEKLGLGLSIAMLAGERSAIAHHQVGCLFHKRPVIPDAIGSDQVEADARVDTALPKVSIERTLITVFVI